MQCFLFNNNTLAWLPGTLSSLYHWNCQLSFVSPPGEQPPVISITQLALYSQHQLEPFQKNFKKNINYLVSQQVARQVPRYLTIAQDLRKTRQLLFFLYNVSSQRLPCLRLASQVTLYCQLIASYIKHLATGLACWLITQPASYITGITSQLASYLGTFLQHFVKNIELRVTYFEFVASQLAVPSWLARARGLASNPNYMNIQLKYKQLHEFARYLSEKRY